MKGPSMRKSVSMRAARTSASDLRASASAVHDCVDAQGPEPFQHGHDLSGLSEHLCFSVTRIRRPKMAPVGAVTAL